MSTLPGNPYAASAMRAPLATDDGDAIQQALLAVAHEIRTANLLAAYTLTVEDARALTQANPDAPAAQKARDAAAVWWARVAPRLGLTGQEGDK